MLDKILEIYAQNGGRDILVTPEVKEYAAGGNFEVTIIKDARSMSFYGLGYVNAKLKPIVAITDGESLPNMLTGLTELNYQNLPFIVIAICNDEKYRFMETYSYVTEEIYDFRYENENPEDVIGDYINGSHRKPVICLVKAQIPSDIHPDFIKELTGDYQLVDASGIKYGALSSFMGSAYVSQNRKVLVISSKQLYREINSFTLRYIKNDMVVIYYGDHIKNIEPWAEHNGFTYKTADSIDELKKQANAKRNEPCVIFFRGEA